MSRLYRTLAKARGALALDTGFDPFLHGGVRDRAGHVHHRPTKAALAALGYPIGDPPAEPEPAPSPPPAQFLPRKLRPMRPEHYGRIIREARALLDRIESGSAPQNPQERRALTLLIRMLQRLVAEMVSRHLAQIGPHGGCTAQGGWTDASR